MPGVAPVSDSAVSDSAVSDSAVSDAELLQRIANQDASAFELLFARYGAACYSLARRIIRDETLAQEVVQEVFLACWRGSGYQSTQGQVRSWLLSLTHHKAVDCVRREER